MEDHRPFPWGVLFIVSLAVFILVVDTATMEVSLAALMADLNAPASAIQSAIAIFTLVKAALMLIGARIQDVIGRKRAFLAGAAIYGIGTLTTAASHSVVMFLAGWSVLDGIGTVLMLPATVTFITGSCTGKDRAFAFGVWGGIAASAGIFGLMFGGFLATCCTWRWVCVLELAVILLIFSLRRILPETRPTVSWKDFDTAGSLLSVLGLAALVLGILQIRETAAGAAAPVLTGAGIALLAGFYLWERRQIGRGRGILVDVTILPERSFLAGNLVAAGQKFISAGFLFVFPLFFEVATGATAYETGAALLPMTVAIVIFSIAGTRLASRFEPKYVLLGGIALAGAGLAALRDLFTLATTVPDILAGSILFGTGLGIVLSQVTNLTMSAIGDGRQTDAAGIYNTTRQLGSSIGTAVIGIVLARGFLRGHLPGNAASLSPGQPLISLGLTDAAVGLAMEWAFTAMILVAAGMVVAGLFIRKTGKIG